MVDLVVVPKVILEDALNYLWGMTDCGPPGEGWKSDELRTTIVIIEKILTDTKEPGAA